VYDAVEPFKELWADSPERRLVRRIYDDLAAVPEQNRYDAILSVAVLEHLTDLPAVVARAAMLLREGGSFRAGFPSEGGLLWGLAWRLTTGVEYRLKRGLDYGAIMRHEHVNTAREITSVLEYFFENVELARFPLPFAQLSFYTAATARNPRLTRCREFLARSSPRAALVHD
jgi:SAM-dependent methyltransferase